MRGTQRTWPAAVVLLVLRHSYHHIYEAGGLTPREGGAFIRVRGSGPLLIEGIRHLEETGEVFFSVSLFFQPVNTPAHINTITGGVSVVSAIQRKDDHRFSVLITHKPEFFSALRLYLLMLMLKVESFWSRKIYLP